MAIVKKEKKKKGLLGNIIEESTRELEGEELDEEVDLQKHPRTGPEAFDKRSRTQSEAVIDELLLSIPNAQGYYLKLHKELIPGSGDWQYKKKIDEYTNWTDLETEIVGIVKSHTQTVNGSQWGTGRYRVTVWNNKGMRGGDKYPPIYIHVDASEQEKSTNHAGMGTEVVQILETLQRNAPPPINPADQAKMMSDAFMKGMEVRAGEGSSLATMMTAVMQSIAAQANQTMQMMTPILTALITRDTNNAKPQGDPEARLLTTIQMLQTMGLVGTKDKDPLEILDKLKAAGYINNQNVDSLSQFNQLRTVINLVKDITGGNDKADRPGLMERAIDAIAPHVGTILQTISRMGDARAQMIAASQQHRPLPAPAPAPIGADHPGITVRPSVAVPPAAAPTVPAGPQINQGFEVVYDAIKANNHGFFPILADLFKQNAPQMLDDFVSGTMNEAGLVMLLKTYGGEAFAEPAWQADLLTYGAAFIAWLKGEVAKYRASNPPIVNPMPNPIPTRSPNVESTVYETQCVKCGFGFGYPSVEEYVAEQKQGGGRVLCGELKEGGVRCDGEVKPRVELVP